MSEIIDKEKIIKLKKESIQKYNALMEKYLKDGSDDMLKKVKSMSYWLKKYSSYIENENNYDPRKQIAYKRGNIVKLNFGFNVGSEYGGLHYAIVLDNKNDYSSSLVTVIPLTSGEERETYRTDVFLGNELYAKLQNKYEVSKSKLENEYKEINEIRYNLNDAIKRLRKISVSKATQEELISIKELEKNFEIQMNQAGAKLDKYNKNRAKLDDLSKELVKMKPGSIALIKQITTVSKQRIYTPRNSMDPLYKISLSKGKMEKINNAVKDNYIFA